MSDNLVGESDNLVGAFLATELSDLNSGVIKSDTCTWLASCVVEIGQSGTKGGGHAAVSGGGFCGWGDICIWWWLLWLGWHLYLVVTSVAGVTVDCPTVVSGNARVGKGSSDKSLPKKYIMLPDRDEQ